MNQKLYAISPTDDDDIDKGPDDQINIGCDSTAEEEAVEKTCNELLTADWAKKCLQVIDPTPFIDSCILDLCMDNTEESKMEILEPFLEDCLDAEEEDEKICLID